MKKLWRPRYLERSGILYSDPASLPKQLTRFQLGRRDTYHVKNIIQSISGTKAVQECGRFPIPTTGRVGLSHSQKGSYFFTGLIACESRWQCPTCIRRYRLRKIRLLEQILGAVRKRNGSVQFLTLTMRHQRGDDLGSLLKVMGKAFNQSVGRLKAKLASLFGYIGYAKGLEVTYSFTGSFHPHLHVLLLFNQQLTDIEEDVMMQMIKESYCASIDRHDRYVSEDAIDLKEIDVDDTGRVARYMQKLVGNSPDPDQPFDTHDKEKAIPMWEVVRMLGRARNVKVGDRRQGSATYRKLYGIWRAYEEGTKGKSPFRLSNKLAQRLGIEEEESGKKVSGSKSDTSCDVRLPVNLELGLSYDDWRGLMTAQRTLAQTHGLRVDLVLEICESLERSGTQADQIRDILGCGEQVDVVASKLTGWVKQVISKRGGDGRRGKGRRKANRSGRV